MTQDIGNQARLNTSPPTDADNQANTGGESTTQSASTAQEQTQEPIFNTSYGTIKAQAYEGFSSTEKMFLSLIQVGSGYQSLNEFTNLRREATNQEKLKEHNFATWDYVYRTSLMTTAYRRGLGLILGTVEGSLWAYLLCQHVVEVQTVTKARAS